MGESRRQAPGCGEGLTRTAFAHGEYAYAPAVAALLSHQDASNKLTNRCLIAVKQMRRFEVPSGYSRQPGKGQSTSRTPTCQMRDANYSSWTTGSRKLLFLLLCTHRAWTSARGTTPHSYALHFKAFGRRKACNNYADACSKTTVVYILHCSNY